MWGQPSPYQVPVHQAAQQQYVGSGNGEAAAAAAAAAQYIQQQQQHAGSYQQQLYGGGQQQQLYGPQQQQAAAGAYAQGGGAPAAGLVPAAAAAGYPAEYGAAATAGGFSQEEQQQHMYSQQQAEQAVDYRQQQQQQGPQMSFAPLQQQQSAAYNQHAAAAVDVYGKAAMEYGMRPGDEQQQQQRLHFSPYPAHAPYAENLMSAAAASARGGNQQADDYYQQQQRHAHHHQLNNCDYGSSAGETHAFSRSLPLVPVSPPADPDLVKRIHTIADYCARHPEMEAMIRERDGTNPRFAFIVGGEGYDYFRYLVACRQQQQQQEQQQTAAGAGQAAGAADGNAAAAAAATAAAQDQLAHAGGNSSQADASATLAREFDIDSLIIQYQEPATPAPLSETFDRELEELVRALEKQATSTGIRNGRHWIEVNGGVSEEAANTLAHALRKKQAALPCFLHKLNLLYLVHDVVQNEHVHKKSGFLLAAFKPYMVWMLRDAYQAAAREQDAVSKVERILTLWAKRGIIDEDEEEEMAFLMTSAEVGSRLQAAGEPATAGFHGPVSVDLLPSMPALGGPYAAGMYGPKGSSPYGFREGVGEMPPPPPPRVPRAVGGFDRRPDDMGNTPESIPVGMMATMLRSMSKRAKNMQTAFVPYRALDPLTTPQQLPPLEPPSDYLLDRLQDFYEDLEEIEAKLARREEREKAGERSRSVSSSRSNSKRRRSRSGSRSRSDSAGGARRWRRGRHSSRSRSNSAEKSPSSCLEGRILERDRERKMREIDRGGGGGLGLGMGGVGMGAGGGGGRSVPERPSSWVHAEMGVGDDGSFSGHPGLRGARLGLGAASEAEERFERQQQQLLQRQQQQQAAASDDPFEIFRRQRAGKYHDIIAINKAARQEQTQRFADKNCYICAKAGHIARDCPAKTA